MERLDRRAPDLALEVRTTGAKKTVLAVRHGALSSAICGSRENGAGACTVRPGVRFEAARAAEYWSCHEHEGWKEQGNRARA